MKNLIVAILFILLSGCVSYQDAPPKLTEATTWQEMIKLAHVYKDQGLIDDDEERAIEIAIVARRAALDGFQCYTLNSKEGDIIETCADSPESLALIAISGLRKILQEQEK